MEIAFTYMYRAVDFRIANNPLDQIRVQNSMKSEVHIILEKLCAFQE